MAIQTQRATQSTKVVVNVGRTTRRRVRRRRAPAAAPPRPPPTTQMPIRELYFMAPHHTPPVQGALNVAMPVEVRQPIVQRPESDPFVAQGPMVGTPNQLLKAKLRALVYDGHSGSPQLHSPGDVSYSETKEFREEVKRLPLADPLRQRLAERPEFDDGGASGVGGFKCKVCEKEYATMRGLRQHQTLKNH